MVKLQLVPDKHKREMEKVYSLLDGMMEELHRDVFL